MYGKKLPRVPLQVDLEKSHRIKPYEASYNLSVNKNVDDFKKKARRILKAVV